MDFMDLPLVMIENIFSYLSFDEIAKSRLVSKLFNEICSRLLNRGFCRIERCHSMALKNVKAQLPRRESERRYHQLSRHCDILTSIETRISMLNMTYSKFIDRNMCCFIPGKVIDEIGRVLSLLEREASPPRAHEVLQELRDISSMAIEHFDDKISPAFRKKLQDGAAQPARPTHCVLAPFVMRQEMLEIKRRSLLNAKLFYTIAGRYKHMYKGMLLQNNMVRCQERVIKQMRRRQKEQDSTIADLKKRMDECDVKYSEITHANVGAITVNEPVQSCNFSSQIKLDLSVLPIGTSNSPDKLLPNIKPRMPTFRVPSLSDSDEPPFRLPSLSDSDEPPFKMPKTEPHMTDEAIDESVLRTNNALAEIRNISKEVRKHINDLQGSLKRSLSIVHNASKKPKLDDSDED